MEVNLVNSNASNYTLEMVLGSHFIITKPTLFVNYNIKINSTTKNATFTQLGINDKQLYGLIFANVILTNGNILQYYMPCILYNNYEFEIIVDDFLTTIDVNTVKSILFHKQTVMFPIVKQYPSIKPVNSAVLGSINISGITVPVTINVANTPYVELSLSSYKEYTLLKAGELILDTHVTLNGNYYGLVKIMFTAINNVVYLYMPAFFSNGKLIIINYSPGNAYLIAPQNILMITTDNIVSSKE